MRATLLYLFMLLSPIAVLVGRYTVPSHALSWNGTYEALAHIWVGITLGMCWSKNPTIKLWAIASLVTLTAFEVAAAVTFPR